MARPIPAKRMTLQYDIPSLGYSITIWSKINMIFDHCVDDAKRNDEVERIAHLICFTSTVTNSKIAVVNSRKEREPV